MVSFFTAMWLSDQNENDMYKIIPWTMYFLQTWKNQLNDATVNTKLEIKKYKNYTLMINYLQLG